LWISAVPALLIWLTCGSAVAQAAAPGYVFQPARAPQLRAVAALDHTVLENFMTERASGRYYDEGLWHNPTSQNGCWWCLDSAGTAAAILSQRHEADSSALVSVAEATYTRAIAENQLPDGAFQSEGKPEGITTGFELIEVGIAYLELEHVLPAATRVSWQLAIERAADYLMACGDMSWYVNGNVQLHQVEDMWLAWQITGAERFHVAYEAEWTFTISPPQSRWGGFGMQITRAPSRPDGSDGSGYLAESGGGAPGFDPEYTMLQLDYATSLWVLTHEQRYLWLANLLFNQLQPLVNSSGILNATGGTRRNDMLPFFSMGSVVLLDSGDRPDLAQFVATQLPEVTSQYESRSIYGNLNFYRGLSIWLSVPLLFEQWPNGLGAAKAGREQSRTDKSVCENAGRARRTCGSQGLARTRSTASARELRRAQRRHRHRRRAS
jgi:hypothetical protein